MVETALQELTARVRTLAGEDRSCWSGPARCAAVEEWAALREAVEAAFLGVVAEWDGSRAWQADATSASS